MQIQNRVNTKVRFTYEHRIKNANLHVYCGTAEARLYFFYYQIFQRRIRSNSLTDLPTTTGRACNEPVEREENVVILQNQGCSKRRLSCADARCEFCKLLLTASPEIRRGPSGKNSLCNKVRWGVAREHVAIVLTGCCLSHTVRSAIQAECARAWATQSKNHENRLYS